jgi:hypothetical protein
VKFGSRQGDEDKENAPQFLNAVNGKAGDGAVSDYSNALVNPLRSPNIHINVTGTIEK